MKTSQAAAAAPPPPTPHLSSRAASLSPPAIEDVLETYASLPNTANLAMGVAHWGPPPKALDAIRSLGGINKQATEGEGGEGKVSLHSYSAIGGTEVLVGALRQKLEGENGLNMSRQCVMVTAGANQAFSNVALALVDPGDEVVLCAPYYFSHLVALQIAQANIKTCRWDPETLLPDLQHLEELLLSPRVRVVALTTPGNPSGAVCPEPLLQQIAALCKQKGIWLVVDETYEHFLHEGAQHVSLCAEKLDYPGIIHIFSMSKSFGLAGWRLGYIVYPQHIHGALRSLQDTIPTHAAVASQVVGLAALGQGSEWTRTQVQTLPTCREAMWSVLAKHAPGTVRTQGAFYFLAQLPEGVSEEEAVHILATEYRLLCTPGSAFGAPGHLRLSYGSLPEEETLAACERLEAGLIALTNKSSCDKRKE